MRDWIILYRVSEYVKFRWEISAVDLQASIQLIPTR